MRVIARSKTELTHKIKSRVAMAINRVLCAFLTIQFYYKIAFEMNKTHVVLLYAYIGTSVCTIHRLRELIYDTRNPIL